MTQKPLEEEEIRLFFSDIQPLPASKVLIQLEKENLSIGERILVQELQLTVRGQEKNWYHRPKWYWKINSFSQVTATSE